MAKDTKDKLIRSARELFAERWFETVSVAEICRHAELSNGVFYRYFKKKEDLFRSINDEFLTKFETELDVVDADNLEERLHQFFQAVKDICFNYPLDVTIFREGQYRFPVYEAKLRALYMRTAEKVLDRPVDEAEYLYIIAGLRFLNTRALYDNLGFQLEDVETFVLKGCFPGDKAGGLPDFPESISVKKELGDEASDRLIEAGIRLFGERGFNGVNVFEIAREAGLSVGAFYLYFEGKEEFLARIITFIGKSTRHYLREHRSSEHERLNQELEGMWYFVNYFRENHAYYEIVREAEFVSRDWVKEYYDKFASGYMKTLSDYPEEKRSSLANFMMGLNHYLGIEAIFYNRFNDIRETIIKLGEFMTGGISASAGNKERR